VARIRTIKPEFWDEDEVTPFLSPLAALSFVGLISVADDEGRGKAHVALLFKRMHGLRPGVTLDAFRAALTVLERETIIQLYSVDGKDYYAIPNFRKHQRIQKPNPSNLPPPPKLPERYDSSTIAVRDSSPPEGKGGEGNGMERKGGDSSSPSLVRGLAEALPLAGGSVASEQTHPAGVVDLLAQAYQAMNPGLISRTKAHRHIEAAMGVGVTAKAIESAVMCPESKGKKLWEILDPLRPKLGVLTEAQILKAIQAAPAPRNLTREGPPAPRTGMGRLS
jgi:hypothetical protein